MATAEVEGQKDNPEKTAEQYLKDIWKILDDASTHKFGAPSFIGPSSTIRGIGVIGRAMGLIE